MPVIPKKFFVIAAVSMAVAIMLGAFGAHGLQKTGIDEIYKKGYHTGSEYHLMQSLGLFAVLLTGHFFDLKKTGIIFTVLLCGIILFSGSLYLMALGQIYNISFKWLGPVTPAGGALMITAWVWLAWSLIISKRQ